MIKFVQFLNTIDADGYDVQLREEFLASSREEAITMLYTGWSLA